MGFLSFCINLYFKCISFIIRVRNKVLKNGVGLKRRKKRERKENALLFKSQRVVMKVAVILTFLIYIALEFFDHHPNRLQ